METRLKRFLSLALAIVMVIGMMPTNIVYASETEGTQDGTSIEGTNTDTSAPEDTSSETCAHENTETTTVAATCTTDGAVVVTCVACNAEISRETIPAGHAYAEEVTTAATCTAAGVKTFTCTVEGCGATKTEEIEAPGHDFVEGVCSVCGEAETPDEEPTDAPAETPTETPVDDGVAVVAEVENPVAKIGEQGYETFDAALTAAAAMSGEVTIEIYGKVEYTSASPNLGASVHFVGKTEDAEICLARNGSNGYVSGNGSSVVSYTDLILSKPEGSTAYDVGMANCFFTTFYVSSVTYTNCTFPQGAAAFRGEATYTGCEFGRSPAANYSVLAYSNVDVTIDRCVFNNTRGIKLFSEGLMKDGKLTVKNTNFSQLTEKPAIVLTSGKSVTLQGNTYSDAKGVFELDLDGVPNGTTVTSDVPPTCINDNGVCGVLVDGKIYTTVAQAAEVATSGSTVTLLHNSAETVVLAEGVTLEKNGFEAANVTVAAPSEPETPAPSAEISNLLETVWSVTDDADREAFNVQLKKINAASSLKVEVYHNDILLTTTTAKDKLIPTVNDGSGSEGFNRLTVNIVLWGNESSSWITEANFDNLTEDNIPNYIKVYCDGELVCEDERIFDEAWIAAYKGLDTVKSAAPSDPEIPAYVAQIGEQGFATLEEAFAAATEGQTITLLADATPTLTSQRKITKAAVIDLGGRTLTLTEDDLYFGTTTFMNGTIVVNPSVKPSTAVFWMFENQTLTFDNVKIVATGVTGTYLIGLEGNQSNLNLLNGSEILIENTTALDLDVICVNSSGTNNIVINNSKVNVTNLDGRVFFRGNYTVSGTSDIDLEGITKAGFRIEAGQTLTIADTATVDIVGEPRDGGIHLTDATATYTKAETATVSATVNRPMVAQVGDDKYATLAEAAAAANSGDEIKLLADVTLSAELTLPAGITLNGNGKQINGSIVAGGDLTFVGHTKVTSFNAGYNKPTITIGAGACLEMNGSGRMVIGHGATFNITGTITDAKTADKANIQPSLIMPGASFTGAGVTFNVTNACIKAPTSYCSSSKSASGTFDFNIENSIWESADKLAFEAQSTAATVNFELKNSVLNTGSHLVFGVAAGEVVIDNSNVNVGTSRQIENRSTMTIKNGSVVNGAVATSSNAINPGTLIVENATYAVTGQFSGSGVGTGTLVIKKGANVSVGSIVDKANVVIDATGMGAGDEINFTCNLSKFAGTVSVENNGMLEAKIVDGKIVLAERQLEGEGTEASPYLINNADDLYLFAKKVNAGSYKNAYVVLTADIDLDQDDWTPINKFNGTFDGQNHTISNLWVSGSGNQGFFVQLADQTESVSGTVKNVTFDNATIVSTDGQVGLIAEACLGARISNVKLTGEVTIQGYRGVGGIVGAGFPVMDNCSVEAEGTIQATYWGAGAILGFANDKGAKVTNSMVKGIGEGLSIYGYQGGVGAVTGTPYGAATNGATVSNVEISSESNYYMAYVDASGTVSGNVSVSNVAVKVNGEEIVGNDAVAFVGTNPYFSLQDAINAADGATVTLLTDIALDATVTIPTGKDVTLELNGKTVSMVQDATVAANATMINNLGNLTIMDSVGDGKLSYEYVGVDLATSYAANTVTSEPGSVLTVKSGTIENLTYDKAVIAYAIDGRTNGGAGDVTINIEGGNITSKRQAVRIFANSTTKTGVLNISGGVFTGRVIIQNASAKANKAALNITDGIFNPNEYKTDVLYVGGNESETINIEASVSGGTFNGEITDTHVTGFISGGTYINDVTKYCEEDFRSVDSGNGIYTITSAKAAYIFGTNGMKTYGTLEKALAVVKQNETIHLAGNVYEGDLTIDENITINGNGFTLKASSIHMVGDCDVQFTNIKMAQTAVYADEVEAGATVNGNDILGIQSQVSYMAVDGDAVTVTNPAWQAKIGSTHYMDLADAIEAGGTVVLVDDLVIDTKTYTIADGKSVTLDMNGKKITATDKQTSNYELFYIYGEMTVTGNGTIELTATNDRDWNASSSIFHNRGGVLNIEDGTFTHKGGTDMAYVVDNSGNWYGDATANIKDGTLTSSYIAIRNRMEQNTHGASGKAILNVSGGTISGTSRAIWAQAASVSDTAPATGEINISGGNVGLIDTARSAGATSMTTISGGTVAAFKGEAGELKVTGGNLNALTLMDASGTEVTPMQNAEGEYIIAVAKANDTLYATLSEALAAGQNGTVEVLYNVTESIEAFKNVTLTTNVEGGVTITNTYAVDEWVAFENVTIGSGVTLISKDVMTNGAYENVIEGTLVAGLEGATGGNFYQCHDAKTIVRNGGKVVVNSDVILRYNDEDGAGIFIYGDNDDTTVEFSTTGYIGAYSGAFYAKDAVVTTGTDLRLDFYDLRPDGQLKGEEASKYDPIVAEFVNSDVKVTGQLRLYNDANLVLTDNSALHAGLFQVRAKADPVVTVDDTSSLTADAVENVTGALANAYRDDAGNVTLEAILLGAGTEADPYRIETVRDLKLFAKMVNEGNTFSGKYVKLMADIDLNNEEWTPIGTNGKPFQGTFDGGEKIISNLKITSGSYVGLFGNLGTPGVIKNVKIENANVNGASYVAALVGMGYTGTIDNCHVSGNIQITGNYMVGGISGHGYANINNCSVIGDGVASSFVKGVYAEANLEGDNVGGIVGHAAENVDLTNLSVKNITVSGTRKVAGIVGITNMDSNVDNCSVTNVVVETTATADYAAGNKKTMSIGGIVGQYQNSGSNGTLKNATVSGLTFNNVNNVEVSAGALTGGMRGTSVVLAPSAAIDITGSTVASVTGATNGYLFAVACIGDQYYTTLADAIAAAEDGDTIELLADVSATSVLMIDKSVTINGNDFKITSSATRVFRVTEGNVEVTMNDLNMVNSAVRVGTNDIRGVSIDDVSGVKLTLNDCSVDFADASATDWSYAVNVVGGSNHTVTINGGSYEGANVINVRGANNTVIVQNAKLTSLYPNNDVYFGACIWVLQNQGSSVEATGNTFNGGNAIAFNLGSNTALTESDNTDNTTLCVAKIGNTYYTSLAEAFANVQDGDTIKILQNAELTESVAVPTGKKITLDLNGKTIAGTDTSTGSFGLINNQGELTVTGDGAITLTATNNRGWSGYSSVISNQPGGKLTVASGTIEHLGGTDMAYGIDNLTNGKGTYAEVVIDGGTVKSPYRAIRQFLNGIEAQNILTVNGGTIEGTNKAIWMQDPSTNANTGTLTVAADAEIKGNVYLSVTENSTEWPVEVSVAAAALADGSEVLTNNLPSGIDVKAVDGVYTKVAVVAQINDETYATVSEAIEAAEDGQTIKLLVDLNVDTETYTIAGKSITLDMNGKKIAVTDKKTAQNSVEGNYELFYLFGNGSGLTVTGNGTIELTALTDRNWNAMSTIFHNRGGTLNIENGTFTHKGGTDMAYVVDNSANYVGDAVANINGGTLTSTYIAIRNRMDNNATSGVATLNVNGGELSGKYAVWGQVSSKGCKGNITITGGDFSAWEGQPTVLVGTDETGEVKTAISGGTFSSEVAEEYCAAGYIPTENADGTYGVRLGKFVAQIGDKKYETLQDAVNAAAEDAVIVVLDNLDLAESVNVPNGKKVTLDLNGKTIAGTDTSTGSFGLINNKGELTVKDSVGNGAITLTATNNRGWSAYSSVISNQPGGKLTVVSGTIEHLGGTDMAYGIDNLTNGKDTYAEVVINGGTVKSPYRAIRQFLNGIEAQNILTVNGGTIEGTNKAIWMQDPSTNANSGTLTVAETATINGAVYLDVTEGSTKWPVEVSIATKHGEPLTENVPDGYIVHELDGAWTVDYYVASITSGRQTYYYETLEEAIADAQKGETIVLRADVERTETLVIPANKDIVLDLNGKTISQHVEETLTSSYSLITNNGTLTVTDSSEAADGKISLSYAGAEFGYGGIGMYTIVNDAGTLNVVGGTVENLATLSASIYDAIDNNSTRGDAVLNISGGTVSCGYIAIRQFCNSSQFENVVNVSGGSIVANNSAIWMQQPVSVVTKGSVNVTGGYFTERILLGASEAFKASISGGTFTESAVSRTDETLLAKTYGFVENGDGTYNVEVVPTYVAKVNGVEYETLQAAMYAANSGDFVYLTADTSETFVIAWRQMTILLEDGVTFNGQIFPLNEVDANGNMTDVALEVKQIENGYVVQPKKQTSVVAGPEVAYIVDGDGTYMSLQAALDAAEAAGGGTVRIKDGVDELVVNTIVVIPTGVTLDIQAKTLTVKSLIGVEGSHLTAAIVDKNGNGSGKLIVAKTKLILDVAPVGNASSGYVTPVWNDEYFIFAPFALTSDKANQGLYFRTNADGKEELYFQFAHKGSSWVNKNLLMPDGATDHALKVVIRLSWNVGSSEEGGTAHQDFVYNDGFVKQVANTSLNKNYMFSLSGYKALGITKENVTVSAIIMTDSGLEVPGTVYTIDNAVIQETN